MTARGCAEPTDQDTLDLEHAILVVEELAGPLGQRAWDAIEATTRLTIEQDDSLVAADRAYLYDAVRRHRAPDLVYHHCRPQEEPLLWVSDAVVWCYAKGGEWRRRVQPIIGSVTSVRV